VAIEFLLCGRTLLAGVQSGMRWETSLISAGLGDRAMMIRVFQNKKTDKDPVQLFKVLVYRRDDNPHNNPPNLNGKVFLFTKA